MKNIAAAFVKAKRAFGPALKDKNNPHFKSKYADLASCIDSVDDALLANGIACIQETFEDATGVTVETVFLHESGESMRCGKLHVPAAKQDPQGYGSALTYARRYSLCAACGIAPEDDDGNAASKAKASKAAQTAPAGVMGAVLDSLPPLSAEDAAYFDELADDVKRAAAVSRVQAYERVDVEQLDAEQKLHLWSRLDSKTRSAIKAESEARKVAA